jgi:hypothetical protein
MKRAEALTMPAGFWPGRKALDSPFWRLSRNFEAPQLPNGD